MKKNQTIAVERKVLASPPHKPPIRALKKTDGKKRNHTKGLINGHKDHCITRAKNGIKQESNILVELVIFMLYSLSHVRLIGGMQLIPSCIHSINFVGFVESSSPYSPLKRGFPCKWRSLSPCRLVMLLTATRY